MKRYMMTLFAIFAWMGMNAMDYETARERAYYLTDKMAYELNLNDQQYNDAYEINLDYLLSLNSEADLIDSRYLAYRNDDLRHILYDWQWAAFSTVDYLFRPVAWLSGGWYFPIFRHYAHDYYFYHRPAIFWDYRGGHGRFYYGSGFYYNRRPAWHGGLRGMHNHMIGHPNGPRGGRYGGPDPHHRDHRGLDRRGGNGYRFDRGGHRPDNDHRNYHGSNGHNPGNDHGNRPNGNGNGFNPGNNSHHNGGGNNNGHHNGGNDRPNMGGGHTGGSHTGGNTPNIGSHNNRGNMGGTRGNAFSGSSRSGHSMSGNTRGGSMGGSRSGGSHGSSRGGGRR